MSQRSGPRRLLRTLALLAATAAFAGCSSDDGGAEPAAQAPPETAPRIIQPGAPGETSRELTPEEVATIEAPTHTPSDVRFMQRMIHHHAQALRMTGLVPKRTKRKDIPLLAQRMEISQTDEIDLMSRWLEERDEDVPVLHTEHGHAHGIGGQTLMPGMATEAEMKKLGAARGKEFDRLFLRLMMRHHQGALTMVKELYAAPGGGQEPEIDLFARHVEADQAIEIERMRQLLAELEAG